VFLSAFVLFGACGTRGGETSSQRADHTELAEPEATFAEPFSSIIGLRELSDSRVFVSDRLGQALMIVDFAEGTADTIGRVGGGPGEYSSPGRLFPWRGDSTLLLDMGNTRFTPVSAGGEFGVSTPLMMRDGESMSLVMPEGTDRNGGIYYQARSFSMGTPEGTNDAPDSNLIVRWEQETGRTDTIAALGQPDRRIERSGGNVMVAPAPFGSSDDWAVSWDGNVGVARGVGFRIEWFNADGKQLVGPNIDYEPIAITQTDRDAWLEERANPPGGGMFISIDAGGGGNVRAASPPRGARMIGPQVADEDWPDVKPPFPPSAVNATPEGELWVQRHVAHGAPSEYDVYDGTGELIRTVILAENSRIVGFGEDVVYVSRTDELDLQWLERYAR
jgi:hypothetical protein